MTQYSSKAMLTDALREKFQSHIRRSEKKGILTGISAFDSLTDGLAAGGITEIVGPQSSGRTSIMISALASFSHTDLCAVIDTSDSFDVKSAHRAGTVIENLLWARCAGDVASALAVTELILRNGLFSFVVFDLASASDRDVRQIKQGHWLRFRRAIENTNIAFIVLSRSSLAQSLASLVVELQPQLSDFQVTNGTIEKNPSFSALLSGMNIKAVQRRPFAVKSPVELRTRNSFVR